MAEAIENSSAEFLPLASHTKALLETVTLSSGLGLMEISTFFVQKGPLRMTPEVIQLEILAGSLIVGRNAYGRLSHCLYAHLLNFFQISVDRHLT